MSNYVMVNIPQIGHQIGSLPKIQSIDFLPAVIFSQVYCVPSTRFTMINKQANKQKVSDFLGPAI